jgi:hypothetical protein
MTDAHSDSDEAKMNDSGTYRADANEIPEDLNEAMVWLEQRAAQQEDSPSEFPSMQHAPEPVGVYDRPQRSTFPLTLTVAILAIILLALAAFFLIQLL